MTGFRDVQGLLSSRTSGKLKTITGPIIMVYHGHYEITPFLVMYNQGKTKTQPRPTCFQPQPIEVVFIKICLYCVRCICCWCSYWRWCRFLGSCSPVHISHHPTLSLVCEFPDGQPRARRCLKWVKSCAFFLVVRRYRIQTVGTILDMGLPTYIGNWFTFI